LSTNRNGGFTSENNSDVEMSSRSTNQPPNALALLPLEPTQMVITFKTSDLSPKLRTKAVYPDPFFRHLTVLPTLNVTLYEALATDITPYSSPLEFVYTEAVHVNNIVEALWTLTQNDDICHASFVGIDMIYRVRRNCKHSL
jgi:hypothetical protein